MDTDPVRLYLVLGPVENPTFVYTPVTDRFHARLAMQAFAEGHQWEERQVLRALIVDFPGE